MIWFGRPLLADELVGREASERLQAAAEVVCGHEAGVVLLELLVGVLVVSLYGGVFDGAVPPLDLAVCPRMLGLCEAMFDGQRGAGVLEGIGPNGLAAREGFGDEGAADPPAPGVVKWMPAR